MKKDYISLGNLLKKAKIPFFVTFLMLTLAFSFEAIGQVVTGTSVCEGSTLYAGVAPSKNGNSTFGLYRYNGSTYTKVDEAYSTVNTVTFLGQTAVGEYQVWSFSGFPPAPADPTVDGTPLFPVLYIYQNPVPGITGNDPVCANSTLNTYTTESGMTLYSWGVTGGSITSGGTATDNTVTVTWGAAGTGHVTVNYTNGNGCTASAATDKSVTINPLPVPGITGNDPVCANSTLNTYTTESGMTLYSWGVTGGSITSGGTATDNTVTVTWGAAGTGHVTVNYTNGNGCTASAATDKSVTINPLPVPGITGNEPVCANSTLNTYTTESGMTLYSWGVTGGSITSGGTATDNTVTVTWGAAGTGHVTVNYTNGNGCTASAATDKSVTINPLPVPGITGNDPVCANSTLNTYTTESGMTLYSWGVTGGSITSGGTATDNTVTVTWGAAGTGHVTVNYTNGNGCTASAATDKSVTINPLPVPGITGNDPVCANSTLNTYTTESGMTLYSWGVTGGSITSGGTATDNTVTVTWGAAGTGHVTVNYTNGNGCTASAATDKSVTINPLPVPGITGNDPVCANSTLNTYTTESGMTLYSWGVTGGSITSGGTATDNTVTVTWGAAGTGHVTVNYTNGNGCTASAATDKSVTINALPTPSISGETNPCANSTHTYTTQSSGGIYGYSWSVNGGSITGGGGSGDNTATITWNNTLGTGSVFVNYYNSDNCTATSPFQYDVTKSGPVQNTTTGIYYCKIQDAIDDPPTLNGHTINVADGTYTITAAITVDKGVTINGNTTTPNNVVVKYVPASTSLNGFEIGAANITIQGFKIIDCFRGIHFGRTDVTSTGCTITNCVFDNIHENAIGEVAAENTTISNNTITNCTQQAIEIRANEATSLANRTEVTGNTISSCSNACIQTYLGKYVYIYDNTINSTNDKGINIIRPNATGTADRIQVIDNTISLCKYPGIQVIGAPYTYVYDNTLTQCNYWGADGSGDWDYASIHVQDDGATAGGNVTVDNNTISDGINGIQIWSDDCTVTNNTIYEMGLTYADTKGVAGVGDGVYYNSGIIIGTNWLTNNNKPTGTTITGNDIHDNYHGLYVRDYVTLSPGDPSVLSVTAENNWWGDATGPYHDPNNTCGGGDAVSDYVDFMPWWTSVTGGAGTLAVHNTTKGTYYCTIQDAIDDANASDVINVADGIYTITAAITVDKGVTINGNTTTPNNVVVKYVPASTSLNGFEIGAANITIQGFKIIDCFRGVHFGRTDVTSTGCTITNCVFDNIHENAIGEVAAENTTISNNTITNCTQQAIEIRANEATSLANRTEVTGNTISSCSNACIQTYLGKYVYIYDNTINSTNDKGINIIRPNATGTADRIQVIDNTISLCKYPGIQVIGAPYTYVYDNTLTQCNYWGADGSGDWDYASIHVQDDGATAGGNVTVDNNTISDGINGIQIWSNNCTVTNNTIYDMGDTYADTKVTADGTYYNSGIIVGTNWLTNNFKPTGTTITGNDIHDNYHGLYVRDYVTLSPGDPSVLSVTAENNWWGDATGPYHNPNNTCGLGDKVSDNVDFIPWWMTATGPGTWTDLPVQNTNTGSYYCKIQDAIDDPPTLNGHTINVADGTYTITAAITVDKGVTINGNTTTPNNVVVKYVPASTSLNGFEIGAANITIQGFKIIDCFRGIHFGRTDVTSTGCTITNCVFDNIHENAIGEVAAENTTISNNTITNCTQQAIEIRANEATSLANRTEVTGNTISSCSNACIQTYLGKYVYIYDNTINSTNDKGINIIRPNATGTADRIQVIDNTISLCKYPGIQVIGAPYTYVYDNTLTQCNYWGADGSGDWDYASIHVQDDGATAGGNVTVDNNTISDGINGIQIWSDDCTVTNNTIYEMGLTYADTKGVAGVGDGVYYNSGIIIGTNWLTNNNKPTGTTITGNDIHDNYHGLYVRDYVTLSPGDPSVLSVTAENNWWGDATGPYHDPNNTCGLGDKVSDNVDFIPWWMTATGPGTWTDLPVQNTNTGSYYCKIQDAINDPLTLDGHTINVADGTYTITAVITVNKGVTITGNTGSPENVVVQYSPAANSLMFDMRASNATIQGIKVTGGKAGFWFEQNAVTGCTISNCIVDFVGEYGIYMKNGGSGHTINLCDISNTGQTYAGAPAVLIENCLDVTFSNNTLSSISDKGVFVRVCNAGSVADRVEVTGNTLSGCSYSCIQVYMSPYTYIYDNTISSTSDKGLNIIGPNASSQAARVVVEGNSITGCPWGGILLTHDRYTYIYNNTISTDDKGISIANGENVTNSAERIIVEGNNVSGTKYPGIQVAYAVPYTYIYNNTLSGCNYYGADGTGDWDYASIHVAEDCGNTIVESNNISDGINGIQVWGNNCTVTNNTIYDMGLTYADTKVTGDGTYYNSGIIVGTNWLTNNFKPTGTTITGNDIHDNYHGLYVRDYATLSPGDPSVLSVTAENNWWGDATGPYHNPNNTCGLGDKVSDNVDFIPWWMTATGPGTWTDLPVQNTNTGSYYCKIQDAIDDPPTLNGHTINVADGTYTITAAITVDKGVTINGNTTTPNNVVVKYVPASTSLNGFEIGAANITIQGFKIIDCFRGIHFGRTDVTSTGCTITNCVFDNIHENAIGEVAAENTTISNNTITNCTQQAIEIRANEATSLANRTEVTGNTISSCSNACIQTYLGKYVYIYDNTINSTNDKGINIIRPNATGTADRIQVIDNTISLCKYPGIQVIGAPYTYVYDNTLTQCNYWGADGSGDWDYASIHVQDDGATAGGNVTVDNNTISDGINGIQIWSDDCTVTNNTIYEMGLTYADTKGVAGVGDGVYYNSGIIIGTNWLTNNNKPTGTTITGNDIHDNYHGLYVRDYVTLSPGDPSVLSVTAENNWWGDATGPYHDPNNTCGGGDAVSDYVDFMPWWTSVTGGAGTLAVHNTTKGTYYCTIQDAIDDANASDVINVADGIYTITAAITVDKGVTINGNTTTPNNVVVKYVPASTSLNGFEIGAANITIQGFKIIDCFRGVHFGRTDVTSTGCTITNCVFDNIHENAIGEVAAENTTISNNTITNCTQQAIEIRANEATSLANRTEVTGNTISSCSNACIQTYLGKYVYIYDNTINSTNDKGINIIRPNATGTADRIQVIDNTISLCKYPGIQVIGAPYTYVYDNTLTQCNYWGADGSGDWDYASIHVQDDGATAGGNVTVDNNTISDGINGIQIWSNNCTVTNNTIYDMGDTYADTKVTADGTYYNSGIIVGTNWLTNNFKPTGTTITGNDIHDNYHGLYVRDYVTLSPGDPSVLSVTAENNWWGDATGPYHNPNNTCGLGDPVSDNVDFMPWWMTATGPGTWTDLPVQNTNTGSYYCKIQDAIDDPLTLNGHTINVADGTYTITAAITVDKGVTINGNTTTPNNVVVKYVPASTSLNGFEIGAANITIQGFKIIDCFRGIHFGRTDVTSTGCTITNCVFDNIHENAIGEVAAENTTISNNTITNCTQQAIEIRANEATSLANRTEVTGNTISSCSNACIQTYLGKYVYIYDNTINSTNDKGINIIRPNATGTADRIQVIDNTISLCKYPGIQVIGAPYTYVYDNTLTQCNYWGADGSGDWDYASIHVQDDGATAGGNVTVDNNTISDGINGIQIWSDDCTVTNNTIYEMGLTYADTKGVAGVGDGVYYNSGIIIGTNWLTNNNKPTGTTITGNDIHDNYHGLYVRDYVTLSPGDPSVLSVTAENNWWGDATGPYHDPNNTCGGGDAVSDYVDFMPWWTSGTGGTGTLAVNNTTKGTYYCKIQDAIDDANINNVIEVNAGTYNEDLVFNVSGIELMPKSGDAVTIKGVDTEPVANWPLVNPNIEILASGVKIHDFTIQSPAYVSDYYSSGIVIGDENVKIYNNAFQVWAGNDANGDEVSQAIQTYYSGAMPGVDISGLYIHNNTFTNQNSGQWGYEGIYINLDEGTGIINIDDNQFSGDLLRAVTVERSNANISGNTIITDLPPYASPGGLEGISIRYAGPGGPFAQSNIAISGNEVKGSDAGKGFLRGIRLGITGQTLTGITVTGNTLSGNTIGALVRSSANGVLINTNKITGNTTGVINEDASHTLNAENNWWGNATGPYHDPNNTCGGGDAVSDYVDFMPWWTSGTGGTGTLAVNNTTKGTYYCKIQDAIDDANANDVIEVSAGTYNEDLLIINVNGLELKPKTGDAVTIKGVATEPVAAWPLATENIDIAANEVKIHGFTIESPTIDDGYYSSGIVINGTDVKIYENDFVFDGTVTHDSRAVGIQTRRVDAIPTADVAGLHIYDNTFGGVIGTRGYYGIYINRDQNLGIVTIERNDLTGRMRAGIVSERSKVVIEDNTLNAGVGAWPGESIHGMWIFDWDATRTTENVDILGNTIENFASMGILMGYYNGSVYQTLTDIVVTGNTITNNDKGIVVASGSGGITIESNDISSNITYGLSVEDGIDVTATCNWWGFANYDDVKLEIYGAAAPGIVEFVKFLTTSTIDPLDPNYYCNGTVPLEITATVSQSKVYGNVDPVFSYSITGGELLAGHVFDGALDRAAGDDVGTYAYGQGTLTIVVNGLPPTNVSDKYTITLVPGTFEITPLPITVTADPNQTKIYGEVNPGAYTYTSAPAIGTVLANAEVVALSGALVRVAGESVGDWEILQGTVTNVNNTNYSITYISDDFAITPLAITVTADPNQTKVYGEVNPAAYTYTSAPAIGTVLANAEVVALSGALVRVAGESVGDWEILQGTVTNVNNTNYSITYISDDFAITPLAITVTANPNQTKVYGEVNPGAYTYTSAPAIGTVLANSEVVALSGALDRVAGEDVGNYAITQGTVTNANNTNYSITYISDDFAITPLAITVTADAGQTKVYGEVDPVAYTYTSVPAIGTVLANSEVVALSGALDRVAGEDVGNYAITQGTVTNANNTNYSITYISDDFTITEKELTIGGSFTAYDKLWDGGTVAVINNNSLTLIDIVGADVVNLTPVAAFADAAVGTGKTVSLVAGTVIDNANYSLSLTGAPTTTADILEASIPIIVNSDGTPATTAAIAGDILTYKVTDRGAGFTYLWELVGGVTNSLLVSPASPNFAEVTWNETGGLKVTETFTGGTGDPGTDQITVTVTPIALQGTITYNNNSNTPMNNVIVRLKDALMAIVATTTTDATGYYKFNTVPGGVTKLEVETAKDWGGANSTDALAIQRTALIHSFPWWIPEDFVDNVGDVNESGNLSSLDALRVKQRTVHLINLYVAGNWAFWDNNSSTNFAYSSDNSATLAYTHSGPTTLDIQAMCYGDVNGSFMPPSTKSMLVIESDGEIDVVESKDFNLPVKLIGDHEIGAMSIFITYPDYLIEVKDLKSEIPGLLFTIEDGWVNVAWSDIDPLNIPSGGTLFTLVCSANKGVNNYMNLFMQSNETQFADANCKVLNNVHLNIDNVKVILKSDVVLNALYSLSCYPNPVKQTANIAYSLPENGRVEISIANSLGVHITRLIDNIQDAGDYILNFDPGKYGLGTGVYNLRMVVQGETSNYTEVVRIVYMK